MRIANTGFAVAEQLFLADGHGPAYIGPEANESPRSMFTVESQASVRSAPLLPLDTRLGPVRIAVTDKERALSTWRDVVGLDVAFNGDESVTLAAGGKVLIVLDPGAERPVVEGTTGLYHVAIHVPTRADLAQLVLRALQRRVRISPTDHLVSEAVYLWDLDGNGIEVTFETPWRGDIGGPDDGFYVRSKDGTPHSGREPIDVDGLLAELGENPELEARLPAGTRVGHIHLHVNDLDAAMRFYRDGLGFGGLFIMRRFGMGDVGLGYMPHAIAFNIWAGPNAQPAPRNSAGLCWFIVTVPDQKTVGEMRQRLVDLNVAVEDKPGGAFNVRDPAQNLIKVQPAG
jgi:catechol 2,3-dioxygenase